MAAAEKENREKSRLLEVSQSELAALQKKELSEKGTEIDRRRLSLAELKAKLRLLEATRAKDKANYQ